METGSDQSPIVVLIGPTASGKSPLAVQLAQHFNGEIVCTDSRTLYRGMDIGTAKPSPEERAIVPHHLLDITTPDKPFNVSDFKIIAEPAIVRLLDDHKLPILTGGSALYIDALIYDYSFAGSAIPDERQYLESLTVPELQAILTARSIPLPNNLQNPRHLIRHIETGGHLGERKPLRANTLLLGMDVDMVVLRKHIRERTACMFTAGLEQEVRSLVRKYGWSSILANTIGYEEFRVYIEGKSTIGEVEQTIYRHTVKLAKRQKTWFKRNPDVHWIRNKEEAVDLITTFLNK